MKRFYLIILMIVGVWCVARAQSNLNVSPFFTEKFARNPKVTMIYAGGDDVGVKGVDVYRSITVDGNPKLSAQLTDAVKKDGANAKSKEVSYRDGELYFGFYFMGGHSQHRRYLLFLNRRPMGKEKVTLIYIEGDISEQGVKKLMAK